MALVERQHVERAVALSQDDDRCVGEAQPKVAVLKDDLGGPGDVVGRRAIDPFDQ